VVMCEMLPKVLNLDLALHNIQKIPHRELWYYLYYTSVRTEHLKHTSWMQATDHLHANSILKKTINAILPFTKPKPNKLLYTVDECVKSTQHSVCLVWKVHFKTHWIILGKAPM
jgi:hypothetical protein